MKGAVSTGHPDTTASAIKILEKGGNAFDAILAGALTSCLAEPIFASLGGGGFLLGHHFDSKRDFLCDFFCDVPGKGLLIKEVPKLDPIDLSFSSSKQTFHIGMASIAVPGVLKGFKHLHENHCTLDFEAILAPTLKCMHEGAQITAKQNYLFDIIKPITSRDPYGREIYNLDKRKRLYNPLLHQMMKTRSLDQWIETMYGAEGSWDFLQDVKSGEGCLTLEDLTSYKTIEREPITTPYRDYDFVSNPSPAFGGVVICKALSLLDEMDFSTISQVERNQARAGILEKLNTFKAAGGTTHLSVIDREGNAASMSLSTGTSCGYFFPETGILMNNMMGEADLHPSSFYSTPAGTRVPSMMSPSFIKAGNTVEYVLGSGGSNRIRSAILQVVLNIIDDKMSPKAAVEHARMHFDEHDVLQIEPGFDLDSLEAVMKDFPNHTLWEEKDMYFGGVHVVSNHLDGWGDSRRCGVYRKLALANS